MVQVKHSFTSAKADGGDVTQIQPSHWNADHTITVSATQKILARKTAGSGAVEEASISETLDFLSSTRGVVAYRGASTWQALSPGTVGQVLVSGGAGADPSWGVPPVNRNRIINGAHAVNQYFGSGVDTTPASGTYVTDRWIVAMTQASKITFRTVADVSTSPSPKNAYYGRLTVASAVSVGAADYFLYGQIIEGVNVADLAWGSANAQPVTISFWATSSISGTFCLSVRNGGGNRSYVQTFALTANTPAYVTITVPGDTSGTWAVDGTSGVRVFISLGCGSNSNTTAGAWQAGGYLQTSAQTQWIANAAATFKITDFQFEPGSIATPFECRLWGSELELCQRYYQRSQMTESHMVPAPAPTFASIYRVSYPVTMRTAVTPSLVYTYLFSTSAVLLVNYSTVGFTHETVASTNTNAQANFTWTTNAELS